MADARIRDLERRAGAGDVDAQRELDAVRRRTCTHVWAAGGGSMPRQEKGSTKIGPFGRATTSVRLHPQDASHMLGIYCMMGWTPTIRLCDGVNSEPLVMRFGLLVELLPGQYIDANVACSWDVMGGCMLCGAERPVLG